MRTPFLGILIVATACTCFAQTVDNSVNVGFPENGVFHGSDIESVQVNNGNLHVQIPLWSAKGRGIDSSMALVSDNKGWTFINHCCDHDGGSTDAVAMETGATIIPKIAGPGDYVVTRQSQPIQTCTLYSNIVCVNQMAPSTCSFPSSFTPPIRTQVAR